MNELEKYLRGMKVNGKKLSKLLFTRWASSHGVFTLHANVSTPQEAAAFLEGEIQKLKQELSDLEQTRKNISQPDSPESLKLFSEEMEGRNTHLESISELTSDDLLDKQILQKATESMPSLSNYFKQSFSSFEQSEKETREALRNIENGLEEDMSPWLDRFLSDWDADIQLLQANIADHSRQLDTIIQYAPDWDKEISKLLSKRK